MLKVSAENATVSEPNPTRSKRTAILIAIIAILVTVVTLGALVRLWHYRTPAINEAQCDLQVADSCFSLENAETEEARNQGLSGRRMLAADRAMLFVFDKPVERCFWMKDMNFSIDIVWLSSDKQVVTVARDVSPSSFPEQFCPNEPAQYVLEFAAGTASELEITPGQRLDFQTNQ